MLKRSLLGVLAAALVLALPSSAFALHKDEVATSGNTRATFSYDYKKTRYGFYDVESLHLAIDRGGQRLFDQDLATDCAGTCNAPAAIGVDGVQSVTVRDLDGDGEPEAMLTLVWNGANCCSWSRIYHYDPAYDDYFRQRREKQRQARAKIFAPARTEP